jgi:hypothetical protein
MSSPKNAKHFIRNRIVTNQLAVPVAHRGSGMTAKSLHAGKYLSSQSFKILTTRGLLSPIMK